MHARPRQTDGRTDEHHGNTATICSITNTSHATNRKQQKSSFFFVSFRRAPTDIQQTLHMEHVRPILPPLTFRIRPIVVALGARKFWRKLSHCGFLLTTPSIYALNAPNFKMVS